MEIVFLLAGCMLSFFGIVLLREQHGKGKPVHILGEVVGYIQEEKQKSNFLYPLVKFIWKGVPKYLKGSIGSIHPRFKLGHKIEVKVWAGEKLQAQIEGRALGIVAWFLIVFGVALIAVFFKNFHLSIFSLLIGFGVVGKIVYEMKKKFTNPQEMQGMKDKLGVMWSKHFSPGVLSDEELKQMTMVDPSSIAKLFEKFAVQNRRVGFALVCIGLGCSYFSFNWYQKRQAFLTTAQSAPGKVVRMETSSGSKGKTYFPVVQYRHPASAGPVEFRHSIGSSPPSYDLGEGVQVLYDQKNPMEAMIDQGMMNRGFPMLCMILSALVTFLGLRMSTKQKV
ncbi:MAG: hypothetical protein A2X86_21810 [Bdellovibrionales bacterium GWA2_49_15]|nr:MAG: hypothetical protein A2X86_21810 [Bdellovibrionales bacterium GWA2_49_15]HAZ12851.1 hypothetical protein [Bdellovibrionales bacterium]